MVNNSTQGAYGSSTARRSAVKKAVGVAIGRRTARRLTDDEESHDERIMIRRIPPISLQKEEQLKSVAGKLLDLALPNTILALASQGPLASHSFEISRRCRHRTSRR